MALATCPVQHICHHFSTGDNKPPNHDVRDKYPCQKWLAFSCEKITELLVLVEYATGEVAVCEIDKIKRLRYTLNQELVSEH